MLDDDDPQDSPRVVVEGRQYIDDRIERWISVDAPAGERLDAADACRMAGFLLDAADGLDNYKRSARPSAVRPQSVRSPSAAVSTTAFISQHTQRCDLLLSRTANAA
jgi:hypothetical protein